jgi:hypothetical protein
LDEDISQCSIMDNDFKSDESQKPDAPPDRKHSDGSDCGFEEIRVSEDGTHFPVERKKRDFETFKMYQYRLLQ